MSTEPRVNLSDIPPSGWQPDWVLAIDGSYQEESIEDGYPGAEIGYIAIAAVLMNVAKIKELDLRRPVRACLKSLNPSLREAILGKNALKIR